MKRLTILLSFLLFLPSLASALTTTFICENCGTVALTNWTVQYIAGITIITESTVLAPGAELTIPNYNDSCHTYNINPYGNPAGTPGSCTENVSVILNTFPGPGGSMATNSYYSPSLGYMTNLVQTTNYTLSYQNNTSGSQIVTVTMNGTTQTNWVVSPGQSVSWTSPDIQTFPTAANDTLNLNAVALQTAVTGTDNGGTPVLNFTPSGSTSSGGTFTTGSGTLTPSGGSGGVLGTNGSSGTLTATNFPVPAATNILTFNTPTGSASESTLEAGIQQAHSDANTLLNGLSIINTSVQNQTTQTTNYLGQILYWATTNAGETWALIHAITNNATSSVSLSNVSLSLTNDFTLTNYAQENTQLGISNLLSEIESNTVPGTNQSFLSLSNGMMGMIPASATNAAAATNAALAALGGTFATVDSIVSALSGGVDLGGDPGHDSSVWEMNFAGHLLDFDPVDNFPYLAAFSFGIWAFILMTWYLLDVSVMYWNVVKTFASAKTGTVPDMEVEGEVQALSFGALFGGNFIGVLVAVILPSVFLAIWVAAVTLTITPLSAWIAYVTGLADVFTAIKLYPAGAAAVHVLLNFLPIQLAVSLVLSRIVLTFTLAKAAELASAASRYLFG